ncbi:unnamed protein product [Hydatigera taeniaeformis]|uniref:Leucine-rich repeat protein 1 n=1 Tax=Hydatigena taeniaeformis TaxID=6205 RepID=A0A0R3WJ86_HYDTA|nr:unnamed protein product [Hydatigera taeniaeformis]
MQKGQKFDVKALTLMDSGSPKKSDDATLVISSLGDYFRFKTFPFYLENLFTCNVGLRSFDQRILQLSKLSVLNLANNRIATVPKALECLALNNLSLKSNRLSSWPSVSKDSALAGSLRRLDLSENILTRLPEDFWNLSNLENLAITDNHLRALPPANMHRAKNLVNIELKNNRLRCLPHAAAQLWEDTLSSLLFGKILYNFRLPSLESQLPRNVEYQLQVLRRCHVCDCACGVEEEAYAWSFAPLFFKRTYYVRGIAEHVPVCLHYCCSSKCVNRVRKLRRLI